MEKITLDITRKTLEELGVQPDYIVQQLGMMNPLDMKPEYIKAFLCLQPGQQEIVSS